MDKALISCQKPPPPRPLPSLTTDITYHDCGTTTEWIIIRDILLICIPDST